MQRLKKGTPKVIQHLNQILRRRARRSEGPLNLKRSDEILGNKAILDLRELVFKHEANLER